MNKVGLKDHLPKTKYRSYKGDMNGTVKNQLLDQMVDERNCKTYYKRNFTTTIRNKKWTTDVRWNHTIHVTQRKVYGSCTNGNFLWDYEK